MATKGDGNGKGRTASRARRSQRKATVKAVAKGEGRRRFPAQRQRRQPGREHAMRPRPKAQGQRYEGSGKLRGKVALITGGDSGIGRAVALAFAKEGADVAIAYLEEHRDAKATQRRVEKEGRECLLLPGDVGDEAFCGEAVRRTLEDFGRLDVLVNNAAEQHYREGIGDVDAASLERVFRTNLFSHFYLVKAALPHLREGSSIITTTSVTAYRGSPRLLDYSCTKGAQVAFTRSLSQDLVGKGIRVNAVAPGPVWTPLIPSSFPAEDVATFGDDYPMGAAQPEDIAPTYVFLACDDSAPYTGQVLHPNSGEVVNG